jgi:hypothetical protein
MSECLAKFKLSVYLRAGVVNCKYLVTGWIYFEVMAVDERHVKNAIKLFKLFARAKHALWMCQST